MGHSKTESADLGAPKPDIGSRRRLRDSSAIPGVRNKNRFCFIDCAIAEIAMRCIEVPPQLPSPPRSTAHSVCGFCQYPSVENSRNTQVLGGKTPIWTLGGKAPNISIGGKPPKPHGKSENRANTFTTRQLHSGAEAQTRPEPREVGGQNRRTPAYGLRHRDLGSSTARYRAAGPCRPRPRTRNPSAHQGFSTGY